MALNLKKTNQNKQNQQDCVGYLAQSHYEEVSENQGPEIILLITELFMSTIKIPVCCYGSSLQDAMHIKVQEDDSQWS